MEPIAQFLAAGNALETAAPPQTVIDLTKMNNAPLLLATLLGLFVTAVVLEQATTAIFKWRVFRQYFNGKALKTPLMFLAGWLVVWLFNYDIFNEAMRYVPGATPLNEPSWFSTAISALVLAGGSAGIYSMLVRLGFRQEPPAVGAPPIEPNEAWISVTVEGAAKRASIWLEEVGAGPVSVLGTLNLESVRTDEGLGKLLKPLLSDSRRFPAYGGYRVKAATNYRLSISTDGNPRIIAFFSGAFANRSYSDLFVDTLASSAKLTQPIIEHTAP